jgi:hypothetical protein
VTGQSVKEAMVFDLRTEAEMRLYSEKTAKELALKKQGEEAAEEHATAEANAAAGVESAE